MTTTTAVTCWYFYSKRVKARLRGGVFAAMELLSETRIPHGNVSRVLQAMDKGQTMTTESEGKSEKDDAPTPDSANRHKTESDKSKGPSPKIPPCTLILEYVSNVCPDEQWTCLVPAAHNQPTAGPFYKIENCSLACQFTKDQSSFALFGPPLSLVVKTNRTHRRQSQSTTIHENMTLPQLVAHRNRQRRHATAAYIPEDLYERIQWMKTSQACPPAPLPTTMVQTKQAASFKDFALYCGDYSFCFRDYVNHEELMYMCCQRYTMDNLILVPTRAGQLVIRPPDKGQHGNKEPLQCTLRETGIVLGFIPICIEWTGRLVVVAQSDDESEAVNENGDMDLQSHKDKSGRLEIVWDTTRLLFGWTRWKRLHKEFIRPAPAEALRKDPWTVHLPPTRKDKVTNANTDKHSHLPGGGILVLHRVGKGTLVYARDDLNY